MTDKNQEQAQNKSIYIPGANQVNNPKDEENQNTRHWSYGSILSTVLLISLVGFLAWSMSKNQRGQVHQGPAPDFSLTRFDGETLTLSKLRGRVVVINFWASWCPPCREEAAYLEQTWRKYKEQGVILIGIDYADTEVQALAYIEEFNITYFNGPDLGTRISQEYNMQGVPETYYVDKNGELRGIHIGPLYYPLLDEKIEELLAEPYQNP